MNVIKFFLIVFLITFATVILISYIITTIYLFSKYNVDYEIKMTTLIGFTRYLSNYKFSFYNRDNTFRFENEQEYMYILFSVYPKYRRQDNKSVYWNKRAILFDPISYLLYFVFIYILFVSIIFPLKRKTTKNW